MARETGTDLDRYHLNSTYDTSVRIYFTQMCAMVGSIGAGTFAFIILFILLVVFFVLHRMKVIRVVFWVYLVCLAITIIVLAWVATTNGLRAPDVNDHVSILITFGVCIFLGLILAVTFFIAVVLYHKDFAVVIPNK